MRTRRVTVALVVLTWTLMSSLAQADPPEPPPMESVAAAPVLSPTGGVAGTPGVPSPDPLDGLRSRVGRELALVRQTVTPYIPNMPSWSEVERKYSPVDFSVLSGIDPVTRLPVTRGIPIPPPDSGLRLSAVTVKVPRGALDLLSPSVRSSVENVGATVDFDAREYELRGPTVGPVELSLKLTW